MSYPTYEDLHNASEGTIRQAQILQPNLSTFDNPTKPPPLIFPQAGEGARYPDYANPDTLGVAKGMMDIAKMQMAEIEMGKVIAPENLQDIQEAIQEQEAKKNWYTFARKETKGIKGLLEALKEGNKADVERIIDAIMSAGDDHSVANEVASILEMLRGHDLTEKQQSKVERLVKEIENLPKESKAQGLIRLRNEVTRISSHLFNSGTMYTEAEINELIWREEMLFDTKKTLANGDLGHIQNMQEEIRRSRTKGKEVTDELVSLYGEYLQFINSGSRPLPIFPDDDQKRSSATSSSSSSSSSSSQPPITIPSITFPARSGPITPATPIRSSASSSPPTSTSLLSTPSTSLSSTPATPAKPPGTPLVATPAKKIETFNLLNKVDPSTKAKPSGLSANEETAYDAYTKIVNNVIRQIPLKERTTSEPKVRQIVKDIISDDILLNWKNTKTTEKTSVRGRVETEFARTKTTGTGVRKGVSGRNREEKVMWGKLLINLPKLQQNIVSISDLNRKKITGLPSIVVSDPVKNAIVAMIQGKKPSIKDMTTDERKYIEMLSKRSGVKDGGCCSDEDPTSRFDLIIGEIQAGNNNPALKNELSMMINVLLKHKKITKEQALAFTDEYIMN